MGSCPENSHKLGVAGRGWDLEPFWCLLSCLRFGISCPQTFSKWLTLGWGLGTALGQAATCCLLTCAWGGLGMTT